MVINRKPKHLHRIALRYMFMVAFFCAVCLSWATQVGAQNLTTITSSEPLQLGSAPGKEWYQSGPWPLIGSVIFSTVTSCITIIVVYLQSSRSFKMLMRQRRLDFLNSSLNDFYNPLLALIEINEEIMKKTGPPSFPSGEIERDAAALVWRETKLKILKNNSKIENILQDKSHLLGGSDSLGNYKELLIHVAMYETFQNIKTDLYFHFQFPSGIKKHVEGNRNKILAEFNKIMKVKS